MTIKSIDANTLDNWLKHEEALLIDVREPSEHAIERIPGAYLIPLGAIENNKLPKIATRKLVVHCRSGHRSKQACQKLESENPNLELYNLDGGILGWISRGYEVVKSNQLNARLKSSKKD